MHSAAYLQYGPYALVDQGRKQLAAVGSDAEAVERMLFTDRAANS